MTAQTRSIEHPPPLAVTGDCKFAAALRLLHAASTRHRDVPECFARAERRVLFGQSVRADVCLWHSLVATERMHAHLVRQPSP